MLMQAGQESTWEQHKQSSNFYQKRPPLATRRWLTEAAGCGCWLPHTQTGRRAPADCAWAAQLTGHRTCCMVASSVS